MRAPKGEDESAIEAPCVFATQEAEPATPPSLRSRSAQPGKAQDAQYFDTDASTRSGRRDVFSEFVVGFFSPIRDLLDDASVSEVLINGPRNIFVERSGRLFRCERSFESAEDLSSALRAVAQFLDRPLSEDRPILEGRLPDGSRLQALFPPVVEGGPIVAIRRHRVEALTLAQLVEWQALTEEAVALLRSLVCEKKNIIVSGGTGSGKTSLLRCLAALIDDDQRIITIEDARELHLQQEHVVALEARPSDAQGRGAVTIGDLFVATLRLRPDRIVIGELRGGEALDLVQAMTSGHGGCLSTVHASTPMDALRRIETMALFRGLELPLPALRAQVASAVDVVVQVERTSEGRRRLRCISEVSELDERGHYKVRALMDRDRDGALKGLEAP